MVEKRLELEREVQDIFRLIDNKKNFLLSGGAGSGKTYSLVQVIRQAILENPSAQIACMTYTNSAVKEIAERVNHRNLIVSTIHDFLWDNIKHFQKELKLALIALINDSETTRISIDEPLPILESYFDDNEEGIQYKEYLKLKDGIISHDELLIVSNFLFERYSKLCDIVKDKYYFIFLDEYQDTSKLVVDIFLSHFTKSQKQNIIGFFGDAMQSIYDNSVENLDAYKDKIEEVKKEQNRRNPNTVINLANRLRTDGLQQVHSNDSNAPNMLNGELKDGKITFLYSTEDNISNAKIFLQENFGWDFEDTKETKELNLTHNLIADKAGFRTLMDVYDKDPIIGFKNQILNKIKEKKTKGVAEIQITEEETFDEIVDKFQLKNRQNQLKKEILLQDPFNFELYEQLKNKPFSEVRKIYFDKESLIDDKKKDDDDESKKGTKRDNLIKHLFKIQRNIFLYQNKNYNEFLRVTDYKYRLKSIADKKILQENIEILINVGEKTIEQVIDDAHQKGICIIDDKLNEFKVNKEYLYNRVKTIKFNEFQFLYEYLEGRTPFSTQHKIKGTEFKNVFIILENGGWNNYNFENLFLENGTTTVLNRTQKIFYVCCTRARENLVVFYHNPKNEVVEKAKEWFGEENVIKI